MEAENDFDRLVCMAGATFSASQNPAWQADSRMRDKIVRRREGTGRQNFRGDVLFAAVRHLVKRDFSSLFFWTGK
jgi:hypothetical protein